MVFVMEMKPGTEQISAASFFGDWNPPRDLQDVRRSAGPQTVSVASCDLPPSLPLGLISVNLGKQGQLHTCSIEIFEGWFRYLLTCFPTLIMMDRNVVFLSKGLQTSGRFFSSYLVLIRHKYTKWGTLSCWKTTESSFNPRRPDLSTAAPVPPNLNFLNQLFHFFSFSLRFNIFNIRFPVTGTRRSSSSLQPADSNSIKNLLKCISFSL